MYKKITIGAFILSLLLFFTLTVIMPPDANASVQENRPLAELPALTVESWFSGSFGEDFETYLSDNVGFRSIFTAIGSRLDKLRGFVPEAKGQLVTLPSGGQLALDEGRIMEIFKENPDARASYTATLNKIAGILPEGADMYLALIPTSIEFTDSPYRSLSDSEKATIDAIYQGLAGITPVNVYDRLAENADSYVYFRTDHHWTQRGAYYGYDALMGAMGKMPIPLAEMEADKQSGFLGYLYNQANVPAYERFADDIEYFMPGENYTVHARAYENGEFIDYQKKIYSLPSPGALPTYSLFMGGDHPFARIDTDVQNGQCALIIKDSYANAMIPYLSSHYETILVIDPRNFYSTVTELCKEYSIDDVIVINYVFTSTFPDFVTAIDRIT